MKTKGIVLDTVERISQLMGELESKAFEQEGFADITMPQMLYLETIARKVQPTFGDIAAELDVTRPSVSAIIKKLILSGYVNKQKSSDDGRVYYLHLTEKGEEFNKLHTEVHQILARRITENLDAGEIEALAELLTKITP